MALAKLGAYNAHVTCLNIFAGLYKYSKKTVNLINVVIFQLKIPSNEIVFYDIWLYIINIP